ncbi:MAG: metal-dependent transcriptional regulator [Euryarchaeota archaeon]|nr:metal-dependent transcriptional regulator [Euryarchaeota archaeon]
MHQLNPTPKVTQREEYLETILYLVKKHNAPAKTNDIAAELKVSPPSVTEMMQKLAREGLVVYKPYYGVTFTLEGRRLADKIKRRQGVLEKFLVDTLGLDPDRAHDEVCRMEHGVSDEVLERLCTFLGHPDACPDGHPIEPGECCGRAGKGGAT